MEKELQAPKSKVEKHEAAFQGLLDVGYTHMVA